MVQSASSSNTQCPSGWRMSSNARVADWMLASRAASVATPTLLLPEGILLDIPVIIRARLRRNRALYHRSGLPHGEDEVGGAVARPYRSLNGGRQPRISPVAGEKQVFPVGHRPRPQRVLLRRRLECRAAFAHDLPGRQLALHATGLAD